LSKRDTATIPSVRLEEQDRDQLLATLRSVLTEAEALSSRIAAVNEISIAINRTLDLDEILRVVRKQVKWLLDFDHCSVCLQDDDNSWRFVNLFGAAVDFSPDMIFNSPNLSYPLKTGQSHLVISGSPSTFLNAYQSQIVIPLVSEEIVMGTIHFGSIQPRAYTQDDLRIGYMLALQLSAAIRNAKLFDELKRAETELRRRAEELEDRNRELDAYNHTIAHDLKSPLTGIVLSADLIDLRFGNDLPEVARYQFNMIKNSGKRMATMIDQLLSLAKLRDVTGTAIKIDMVSIVEGALMRFNHVLKEKDISVVYAADMPPGMGHAQWAEEVFANLISNAIKYMGEDNENPSIQIRGFSQGDKVRYEVEDTGVGIDPSDQARLFEMFTRLHTVKGADGLGLGLSIVHRIVTKLGGQVGVESEPDKGSTFWFTLPAAPALVSNAPDLSP